MKIVVILYCLGSDDKKKSLYMFSTRGSHCRPNYIVHVSNSVTFFSEYFQSKVVWIYGYGTCRYKGPTVYYNAILNWLFIDLNLTFEGVTPFLLSLYFCIFWLWTLTNTFYLNLYLCHLRLCWHSSRNDIVLSLYPMCLAHSRCSVNVCWKLSEFNL